jgi:hypothetical protein
MTWDRSAAEGILWRTGVDRSLLGVVVLYGISKFAGVLAASKALSCSGLRNPY